MSLFKASNKSCLLNLINLRSGIDGKTSARLAGKFSSLANLKAPWARDSHIEIFEIRVPKYSDVARSVQFGHRALRSVLSSSDTFKFISCDLIVKLNFIIL